MDALQEQEGRLWVRPRASRHCPTESCHCLPRTKVSAQACERGWQRQGSKPGCPLLSTTSSPFPPWPSQDKGWSPRRFSHQAFIIKKVPELPSHPLQPSPHGLRASPSAGWVCCRGSRVSHGGLLLTGTEWVIFFQAFSGGVSARSACPLEQSFPVLCWEPLGTPPRVLCTSGSYSQLAREKFFNI